MKIIAKRSLAWLMTLMMCVTLFCGVWTPAQAATVNYVTSGNYVYNWGQRETVATFLSPMAEDWYEKNNTSYEELSALSGASSTSSVPSSALYRELQSLMKSNHKNITSYDGTKNLFRYTDCQNSGGAISSFYSGKSIGPSWDGSWNREHTWPNSKGDASGQGENDIIMLRPTSTSENSSRGNKAYGESSGYYHPNSESNNKYDLRGDVARIMLFVYCRWGNTGSMWGSSGVMESLTVLLRWVTEDPVDTWELGRNDAAESITGTRNVFVDYPELIFALFNEDVPEDYDTPSGIGAGVTYTVTATSNNTAYGTVSVSGKTINATPKSGYMVSGYDVVSGTATVTRDGNTFKVSADSDVSIRINFAPRTQVTVQFSQQGSVAKTQSVYSGDSITLPAHTGTVPAGLTFVGWVEQLVEETTEKPTCYTAGSSYTVNSGITLYALYSRLDGEGSGNSDVYELVTSIDDLQSGDKIIICAVGKSVALSTNQKSNNRGEQAVTVDGNCVTWVEGVQVITVEAGKNANTYAFNVGNGYLCAASSSANYLRTETSLSTNSSWSISIASKGSATIKSVGSFSRNWMRYNSSASLFACYGSGQGDIAIYEQQSGTISYFTGAAPVSCPHTDAYDVAAKEATCTEAGYTAGVYCPDCEEYVSGHETVNALNHKLAGYVNAKEPTCSEAGYAFGLFCPDCDKYLSGGAEIPATGEHTYDNACDADCNVCGATRTPSAHAYDNACDADCNACGATREVADHAYDNACDVDCNVCGATREVADHTYESAVTTAPTCGADGVRTYTCSACGDAYTEVEPATGAHTYDNACDTDCNGCGATREVADHTYESAVTTAPTCTTDGVRTYTCTACGDSYTEAIVGDHAYDNVYDADCNVCGESREVVDMVRGDADGDGKLNNRDVAALQRYLNGWDITIYVEAVDMNADGKLNNQDLVLLIRYTVGWEV